MASPTAEFIKVYEEAAAEIVSRLDELAATQDFARKAIIYNTLVRFLQQLKKETEQWGNQHINKFIEDAARKAGNTLNLPIVPPLGSTINREAIESLTLALTQPLENIQESVTREAIKLYRSTSLVRTFPELDRKARYQVVRGLAQGEATTDIARRIRELLKEQYQSGIVSVVGKNGKEYHFSIPYYSQMVANNVRRQSMSVGTILRAQASGEDLVIVSANPPLQKNCECWDHYGNIYSISGQSQTYPKLERMPPWHPHCRHSIQIYVV